jgi:hypothetical protein
LTKFKYDSDHATAPAHATRIRNTITTVAHNYQTPLCQIKIEIACHLAAEFRLDHEFAENIAEKRR